MSISAWIDRLRKRRRWKFIGFVTGEREIIDDQGNPVPGGKASEVHSLFERGDGLRKVLTEKSYVKLMSEHAVDRRARVAAWKAGGPLPPLDGAGGSSPKPKPKKPIPVVEGKPTLRLVATKSEDAA